MKAFLLCVLGSIIGFVISPSNCGKGCKGIGFHYSKNHYVSRCYCEDLEQKCAGCLEKNNCKEIDKKCQKYEEIKQNYEKKLAKVQGQNNAESSEAADEVDGEDTE